MSSRYPARLAAAAGTVGGAALAAAAATATRRRWAAAPDPTEGRPLELPAGDELAVTTGDGARLAARVMGPAGGPPVVLGHGWTGERRIWASVARRLVAGGHRVVVWDQRGHGASSVGAAGLTVRALAADVAEVLAAVDARRAVLAGHSMGGMAVQAFAVDHPAVLAQRVERLVLVATAARSPLRGPPGGWYERLALAVVANAALTALGERSWVGLLVARQAFGADPPLAAIRATRSHTEVATRVAFLRDMARLDLRGELGRIGAPVTVVHGDRDRVLPLPLGREVAAAIPGARLEEVTGAGHQLPFERPALLAATLAPTPASL